MLTLIMMEDIFRKNGILSESSSATLNKTISFSREYIDNITFCKTYNIFHKISDYMEYIVDNNMKNSLKPKILKQKNLII